MIASSPRRAAFTLIELVVTISVIILLTGLTVSMSSAVIQRTEIRRTEDVLRQLDLAHDEWRLLAGRELTWWELFDDPALQPMCDVHADTPEVLIITEVLDVIARPSQVKGILAGIDPRLIHTYSSGGAMPSWIDTPPEQAEVEARFLGDLTILDAWGAPVYATHPGRVFIQGQDFGDPDADGTIRTYNELVYGLAANRRMRFVSAGPDGQFGVAHAPPSTVPFKLAADNVCSYPITGP
jgi:type II secretory pathway pseudopilin PulG